MAETWRQKSHAHETNALSYGHFGTASYDEIKQKWSFLRQATSTLGQESETSQVSNSAGFQLVEVSTTSHEASQSNNDGVAGRTSAAHGGLRNHLLINLPEAAALATTLQSVTHSADSTRDGGFQGSTAKLLAFGYARPPFDPEKLDKTPRMPIFAFRSASRKNILEILGFETRQALIPNQNGSLDSCSMPYVAHRAVGQWSDSTDEIVHVASAADGHPVQFLLVKPSGTTVLHPALSRDVFPSQRSRSRTGGRPAPDIILDACPVVTIPASQTGGEAHVHAAFRPSNNNILAIIDSAGQVSVWKMEGQRSPTTRTLYRVYLQGSNNLMYALHLDLPFRVKPPDVGTWHRTCWLKDHATNTSRVLVCNRRYAGVFDAKCCFLGRVDMRLSSQASRSVILDAQTSSLQPNCVFVLTSNRLLMFKSASSDTTQRRTREPLELQCSWSHYRDKTDISLRMTIMEDQQGGYTRTSTGVTDIVAASHVLVWSSASNLCSFFRFAISFEAPTLLLPADPAAFTLPGHMRGRMHDVQDIVLCLTGSPSTISSSEASRYDLVKLIATTSTGDILEATYKYDKLFSLVLWIVPPAVPILSTSESLNRQVKSAYRVDDEEEDMADFVVRSSHWAQHKSGARVVPHAPSLKVRSWQKLYYKLHNDTPPDPEISIRTGLEDGLTYIGRPIQAPKSISTILLSDIVTDCWFTSLEEDADILDRWLEDLASRDQVKVESALISPHAQSQPTSQSLLAEYNTLVASYVHSLASTMLDRQRVNRERLVRQLLGPTMLGGIIIKLLNPATEMHSLTPATIQNSSPVPCPTPRSELDKQLNEPTQETSLESSKADHAKTRLHRFANFKQPKDVVSPSPPRSTSVISTILGHLPDSIDEDPSKYSYQLVNERLKLAQEAAAAQSQNPQEKERAERAAARIQQKLDKNRELTEALLQQRDMLPSIAAGASTTQLPTRQVQSSQVGAPESSQVGSPRSGMLREVSMTQPERGAFGHRQAVKKGKKRQVGF
jgi:hypothetical protein